MSEYRLSKQIGLISFELFLEVELDSLGNVIFFEFYDGCHSYDNPSNIRFSKVYCDESKQEEWDLFLDDLLQLFDSKILFESIGKLKKEGDSYYFSEEEISLTFLNNF